MAKSPNSKSMPHHFLCCFGFSGNFRRFKSIKPAAGHKKRPFSWIKLRFKPRPTFSAEQKQLKPDSARLASRPVAPVTGCMSSNEDFAVMLPAATNQSGEERPEEVINDIIKEKTILETVKHSNSPKKPADQTPSRFSLARKLESFRSSCLTQLASPSVKEVQKSTTISHTFSFPPPNPAQCEPSPGTVESNRVGLNDENMSKNYGPVAGMSILIMTLAIMVLWGKLYAIFCTATWIYIVTSLKSIVEEDDDEAIDFIESDSCSQGFKKKLLFLKGFLYRNEREKKC